MRVILPALLVVLVIFGSGCSTPEPSRVLASGRIAVYGTPSPAEAVEMLGETQRHVEAVSRFLALPTPEAPLRVVAFHGRRATGAYLAAHCPKQKGARAACWEEEGRYQIALTLPRNRNERARILRHELTHYVLASHFYDVPPWIDEGLAQYFAGDPPGEPTAEDRRYLRRAAREDAAYALDRLVALPSGRRLTQAEYAWAWALTALMVQRHPEGIRCYLRKAFSGPQARSWFHDCFGAWPGDLEAAFRGFLRSVCLAGS